MPISYSLNRRGHKNYFLSDAERTVDICVNNKDPDQPEILPSLMFLTQKMPTTNAAGDNVLENSFFFFFFFSEKIRINISCELSSRWTDKSYEISSFL